jgi:predicted nucleic acid-binding protein
MIVADTGAIIALLDRKDPYHADLARIFRDGGEDWILPWAILPEVDYLAAAHLGPKAQDAFLDDLASGAFAVEWGDDRDVERARELHRKHRALRMGLVDGVVMATAERLGARAIATLDLRHFGPVQLRGAPRLLPRDR